MGGWVAGLGFAVGVLDGGAEAACPTVRGAVGTEPPPLPGSLGWGRGRGAGGRQKKLAEAESDTTAEESGDTDDGRRGRLFQFECIHYKISKRTAHPF